MKSPRKTFYYNVDLPEDADIPLAWKKQVRTIYQQPLRIAYENLDPTARYRIRGKLFRAGPAT
ncbi:MAG: hypothetical protein WDM96_17180 [Lacunisphaera sp.]